MTSAPWVGYLLALGASAGLVSLLTPVAMRVAMTNGWLDHPGGHKGHASATPYLGGVAMVAGFVVAVALAAAVARPVSGVDELAVILGAALALALVGLLDDLRGLGVALRFAAQIAAGLALWAVGVGVNLFPVEAANLAVTLLWVVGITNALNLLDNMDGLSAGVATIAAGWFGLIAAVNGQVLVASLAFALAGCAAGFLVHNRPPARIYMGDAGSLFLGVLLAAIGIKLEFTTDPVIASLIPILVLTVPVLDTALVVVERVRHGRSPLRGGRDHLSHRLVRLGLPPPAAVGVIAGLGIAHGWMALLLSRVDLVTALLGAGLVLAVDAVLFVFLTRVPVYEADGEGNGERGSGRQG